jgi:hypothetical protein
METYNMDAYKNYILVEMDAVFSSISNSEETAASTFDLEK